MPADTGSGLIFVDQQLGKFIGYDSGQRCSPQAQGFQSGRKLRRIRERAGWTGIAQAKIRNTAFRLHPVHDKWAKGKLFDNAEKLLFFGRRHNLRPEDESSRGILRRKEGLLMD